MASGPRIVKKDSDGFVEISMGSHEPQPAAQQEKKSAAEVAPEEVGERFVRGELQEVHKPKIVAKRDLPQDAVQAQREAASRDIAPVTAGPQNPIVMTQAEREKAADLARKIYEDKQTEKEKRPVNRFRKMLGL
ncbi:hypothetical protein COU36_05335 [Candidatus Micrarchaeota archaeon CG10_big_fil_rev_8_21_14_0_10_59_7]|nr:MAG: hypothetical protein COU36_05335 [Candidatus Micrarchaeota archaeon CG10_big_fil_rev_8_21_14_0_10_59_7]